MRRRPRRYRLYLKEFLSDRNVVDMPAFVWKPILNLFHPAEPARGRRRRAIRGFGRTREARSSWIRMSNAPLWKSAGAR